MNYFSLIKPFCRARLELAQEEGIPECFRKDAHLVAHLPSAFSFLLASVVLTFNLYIL